MRKIITLVFFQVYVDVLGFPVYLKHTVKEFKNNTFIAKKDKQYLLEQQLIK